MLCLCNKRLPEMFLLCTQNVFDDRLKLKIITGGGGGGGEWGGEVNIFMLIPPYNTNY